ncbi:MAG: DNA translocase FtsK [Lactobacillaceae bacterium]|jgi:S-DNA-T family DNA segregation ATPase FtsK/SpoIIIE|nr:DNA translocase FtsK [Lactobacillaceae bacterium]
MAKTKRKRRPTSKKKRRQQIKVGFNITGLAFMLIAILAVFRWGFLGNLFANTFRLFVGDTYLIAAVVFGMTGLYLLFSGHFPDRIPAKRFSGMVLVYLGSLVLDSEILFRHQQIHTQFFNITWSLLKADFQRGRVTQPVGGGLLGALGYSATYFLVSNWGTILIAILVILAGLLMFAGIPFQDVVRFLQKIGRGLQFVASKIKLSFANLQARLFAEPDEVAAPQKTTATETDADFDIQTSQAQTTRSHDSVAAMLQQQQTQLGDSAITATSKKATTPKKPATQATSPVSTEKDLPTAHDGFDVNFTPTGGVVTPEQMATNSAADADLNNTAIAAAASGSTPATPAAVAVPPTDSTTNAVTAATADSQPDYTNYQLPTTDLLSVIPPTDQSGELELIQKNRHILAQTFQSFGVDVKIIHADLGPTVTKYEVKPGLGVKVNKIVNLADDLALALAAKDIRIEAPIPGKPYVGIEVPNRTIATVSFREVIERQPRHPGKVLEVPLGKSVTGQIMTADLTKMPHLLIAGSTGSGKSVMINVIITSILMHARPDEVKLMLIDPKMVELSVYNDIPHLLLPVVTDPKKAANALNKAVTEMEDRYQRFEAAAVRDIKEYNLKVRENNADKNNPVMQEMPFLVIVIDELADLMMVAGNEVETSIVRLAQKARAAGVHLIIATQRPSVDVITGLIKANIPSRIAFAVSSGIDSRTILDMNGAEKLLGRGDMMFAPLGLSKPVRVQGAYISSQDVEQIIDFVKAQRPAEYDEELMAHVNDVSEADPENDHDEHFNDAVAYVIQEDKASTSMIQRRFRIGYNRAALIVEDMEKMGVVGPSEGSKGRKVLWTEANYQQFVGQTPPAAEQYLS